MIAKTSKDDLAEVARILAMQSAHYARKYGELQLPDLVNLLSATHIEIKVPVCCVTAQRHWSA